MKNTMLKVAIPVDVKDIGGRPFHAVGEKYINAVAYGSQIRFLCCIPALSTRRSDKSL